MSLNLMGWNRTIRLRWRDGSLHTLARALGLALTLIALSACNSLDSADFSGGGKPQVPGEVNPDAPDAAQNVRTSPGWNF